MAQRLSEVTNTLRDANGFTADVLESTRSGMENAGDDSELNEESTDEQYAMGSRGSHEPSDSGRGGNLKSRGLIDNT